MDASPSPRKRAVLSVRNATTKVARLYENVARLVYESGQGDVRKACRSMLSLSNSVAIVLIEFEVWPAALKVLKKALRTDVLVFFEGETRDRLWFQRPLTYLLLAYVQMTMEDYQSSLQFLYDAERLLLEFKPAPPAAIDCSLVSCMISFLALFRMGQYGEARKYLSAASVEFNEIGQTQRVTKFKETQLRDLYGLIFIGEEVLNGVFQQTLTKARDLVGKVRDETSDLIMLLEKKCYQYSDGVELVMSNEYRKMLFLTCFFPFLSRKTPRISRQDLSNRQFQKSSRMIYESYASLMREAMSSAVLY